MDWLIATIKIGLATAVATTFDDNIYLTAFFSEVNRTFRPQHVVVGEIIGFTALVTVSFLGFFLGLAIPSTWTGLLGILPILIGLNNLFNLNKDDSAEDKSANLKRNSKFKGFDSRKRSLWDVIRDRQTYRVSAVTISNGGNNLGIYIPLFASNSIQNLAVIVPVCYFIVCCWLFMSYTLTHQPGIALVLSRYAGKIFPFVLMWLGFRILMDSESYRLFLPNT
ncbi:cadmium resistance transporter [Nostoc sp. 'Peltigera malacea cyanobiont' DB3992]|uniref:cadmium resistance transporter n=1 Tax=Nostoc sp. 'Peltigera malacea cyanobiont' DB3992 TaxID=1206980 RepID=UPI000C047648|nr:cadmium resistance transporter [Nostoc sp. 'Peltigera malacea cyanobiont' DB3992]PHM06644.1 transporter [Nostoc sp. 'Peltigera malacea cyanobiont' DB3992]